MTAAGRPVHLTTIDYGLLSELSANAGQVLTQARLLERVWGPGRAAGSWAVRTAQDNLRRKLGDDAHSSTYIFNEPRVG